MKDYGRVVIVTDKPFLHQNCLGQPGRGGGVMIHTDTCTIFKAYLKHIYFSSVYSKSNTTHKVSKSINLIK